MLVMCVLKSILKNFIFFSDIWSDKDNLTQDYFLYLVAVIFNISCNTTDY